MDATQFDQRFRYALWFFTLSFAALRLWLEPTPFWAQAGFVIAAAGMVGYYTNFLAIRMLFQPKQGKVLGWEGLVPKNQEQIANSLAESVQNQLLSPDVILDYLHRYELIERGTQQLSGWMDRRLSEPDLRRKITRALIQWLRDGGPELLETVLDLAEQALRGVAKDPAQVEAYWQTARDIIADYLRTQTNREDLAQRLQKLLLEDLPQIAEKIDEAVETYLRRKNAMGSIGMSVKKVFSVDDETIRKALQSFMQDPDTSQQFVGVLDQLMEDLIKALGSDETQALVVTHLEDWVQSTADFSRQSILPRGLTHLQAYLDDPSNWNDIERLLLSAVERGKDLALQFVDSERGQQILREAIEKLVHRINVTELVTQQVMALDTDELEAMILNNTGGNLVVIQTLGGGLGLVAGLVQVHMAFALPLLGVIGVVWVAFALNQRRYSKSEAGD